MLPSGWVPGWRRQARNRRYAASTIDCSAQFEGNVGQEETSDYVRIVVPMCFYSSTRRVTIQSTMVGTVDGIKSDEREAASAAKKIAGDIEFDLLRGGSDFSRTKRVSAAAKYRPLGRMAPVVWKLRRNSRTNRACSLTRRCMREF